ncbi:ribonuclease J [Robertmurraya yapensis]|uniref:Ribonuclease J n=1 Tax=Bacillus yapensis TaxID=2492960 RepID=A0A3S0KQL8_9BACI|nr:ribonuclease J [Bacillus yapensis]RTR35635.1 ribonuclease J [Bacillus yapensis]TKS98436.1 RNase J family beta-CASP ribonuclease [Bacillus yapensis]
MNIRTNENIKVVALGGVGEIGKNMYIVEVDNDLFVLDAGLMLPENEMLGIDIVIPDITYLTQNKERVKGIFLTHGHEDHIGALSYVLRQLQVPIYGTKLTLALAKAIIKEQEFKGKAEFIEINSNTMLEFDEAKVSFFKTNHSIPDSVGIAIHTSKGAVVYTGDFKFDQTANELYKPEIGKMAQLGEEGVLCLLSDSTDAEKPGYTPSEAVVIREMKDAFYNARGRIIAASFASDLNRIQHIFDAAYESRRKIAVVGKSLQKVFDIAIELDYLYVHHELIIPINELKDYADDELVILTTGMQGEPIEALQKMAKGQHKQVNVQKGDTVLIAASPLRGREVFVFKTIDMLSRAGANVISGRRLVNTSSHGSQEELKFMLNLMNPKFFIPVHGEYRMLRAHSKIAKEIGITDDRIAVIDKGEVVELNGDQIKVSSKVAAGNVLVDGNGVGDVGNIVLRDRKLLSQDGILIVVVTLNKAEKKVSAGPEIISRGFVYVRESEELMEESVNLVRGIVEKNLQKDFFDWTTIKQDMRDGLNQYLYEKTKRRPMILPIIMEV